MVGVGHTVAFPQSASFEAFNRKGNAKSHGSTTSNGNRPKLSEKGVLTPNNCVVALVDHQDQMLFGQAISIARESSTTPWHSGKAARVFDVPMVLTTVETKSFSGHLWPQLRA